MSKYVLFGLIFINLFAVISFWVGHSRQSKASETDIYFPDPTLTIHSDNKVLMEIKCDGRIILRGKLIAEDKEVGKSVCSSWR